MVNYDHWLHSISNDLYSIIIINILSHCQTPSEDGERDKIIVSINNYIIPYSKRDQSFSIESN